MTRGVTTNFWWGGRNLTGGTDSGGSKPPTPKFRFLLGFCPLFLEILENPKNSKNFKKKSLKNRYNFWGTSLPELWTMGTCPPHPCGGAALVSDPNQCLVNCCPDWKKIHAFINMFSANLSLCHNFQWAFSINGPMHWKVWCELSANGWLEGQKKWSNRPKRWENRR